VGIIDCAFENGEKSPVGTAPDPFALAPAQQPSIDSWKDFPQNSFQPKLVSQSGGFQDE
jgi:hypothetical protein